MPGEAKGLRKYRCHKEVRALKIASISGLTVAKSPLFLHFEGQFEGQAEPVPHEVTPEWFWKHTPVAGGYYVVYADGYDSFSPAKAFEDGYELVEE